MLSCRASTRASESRTDDLGFPRRHRLTRGAEIQAVIREGKRLRTAHLDVRVVASPHDHSRVGFVIPKHRMTSVRRNQLKRRLRELARVQLLAPLRRQAGPAVDLVIRARHEAYAADVTVLRAELESVRARLGVSPVSGGAGPRDGD